MHITICDGDKISNVDLPAECPVENLLALAMADLGNEGHDAKCVHLLKDGKNVLGTDRTKTIADCGLAEGDLLLYTYSPPRQDFSAISSALFSQPAASSSAGPSNGATSDLDEGRKRLAALLGQTNFLDQIKKVKVAKTPEEEEDEKCRKLFDVMHTPQVKAKVYSTYPAMVTQYLKDPTDYAGFKAEYLKFFAEEKRKIAAINDPFSAEGQALLMEQIRQENCNKMYEEAMERNPEALVPIHMLYVRVVVNGVPTLAFIDSGAQISIMSGHFAERANLSRFIDTRFVTTLSGVGGADRTLGAIHCCEFEMGDAKFECKVQVQKEFKMDILIGLDFLRRHACCIDLGRNRLSFTDATFAEFLPEQEVKKHEAERKHLEDARTPIDEKKMEEVISMGFAKKDAEDALRLTMNDVKAAVQYLFGQAQKDAEDIAAVESNTMEH